MNQIGMGANNGLSPIQHQAITSTNAYLLSIKPIGTNLGEIRIKIQNLSLMKMPLKILSAKWWPFCSGGDELTHWGLGMYVCIIWTGSLLVHIDGLVQERCNSSALAMELRLSCTNPLISWLVACSASIQDPNQCSFIVNWTQWKELPWNINKNMKIFFLKNAFEREVYRMLAILFWPQYLIYDISSIGIPAVWKCFLYY